MVKLFGILLNVVNYYCDMGLLVFVIDIECKPFGFEVLYKKSSKRRFCFVRAETEFKIKETSNMHIGHVLSYTGFKYEVNIDILSYKTRQPNLVISCTLSCKAFIDFNSIGMQSVSVLVGTRQFLW